MKAAPVQCIDCAHFNLRKYAAMAKQGYGTCGLDPRPGRFQSAVFERHCEGFSPASVETAAKRRQWLADEDEKFSNALKEVMHDHS